MGGISTTAMRILYINSIQYEYTTATLTEGLYEFGCHVRCSAQRVPLVSLARDEEPVR